MGIIHTQEGSIQVPLKMGGQCSLNCTGEITLSFTLKGAANIFTQKWQHSHKLSRQITLPCFAGAVTMPFLVIIIKYAIAKAVNQI
jgi:hypothetical protein